LGLLGHFSAGHFKGAGGTSQDDNGAERLDLMINVMGCYGVCKKVMEMFQNN
jgi:hypothetical protein